MGRRIRENRRGISTLARQEALANLAASISTTVESEIELENLEDSTGATLNSLRRRISEKVYQTLEGAEVVDSYYSPQRGYWIYLRYAKESLDRHKREISRRVVESATPLFAAEEPGVAEALSLIEKSRAILLDSPYFATLRGRLGGTERVLIDLLEEKAALLLSSLEFSVSPDRLAGVAGEEIVVSALFSADKPTGRLPVLLLYAGETHLAGMSDTGGRFSAPLDLARLPVGRGEVVLRLDLPALGLDPEEFILTLPRVARTIPFEVKPLPLGLRLEYSDEVMVEGIESMAISLFSDPTLPFSLTSSLNSLSDTGGIEREYLLSCRLIVEDFPRYKENSLEISQARLIIQVERAGEVLYAFESGAMKDGGLTLEQAHERTVKKLFQKVKNEQAYLEGMLTVLPIRVAP